MEELKSLAKNVEVEHTGGISWATLGHRIHGVEYLCRPDDVGHEHKEHGWAQQRQCNRKELLNGGGPVKRRSLIEIGGNAL